MTVDELIKKLEDIDNKQQNIVIRTNNPSVGGCAWSGIHCTSQGIDWDSGKVFINAKDKLYKEDNND